MLHWTYELDSTHMQGESSTGYDRKQHLGMILASLIWQINFDQKSMEN